MVALVRHRGDPAWRVPAGPQFVFAAVAAACLVAAASMAWRDTPLLALHGAIPLHVLVSLWLLIGLVFRDRFAAVLRRVGLGVIVVASVVAAASVDAPGIPPAARCGTWRRWRLARRPIGGRRTTAGGSAPLWSTWAA